MKRQLPSLIIIGIAALALIGIGAGAYWKFSGAASSQNSALASSKKADEIPRDQSSSGNNDQPLLDIISESTQGPLDASQNKPPEHEKQAVSGAGGSRNPSQQENASANQPNQSAEGINPGEQASTNQADAATNDEGILSPEETDEEAEKLKKVPTIQVLGKVTNKRGEPVPDAEIVFRDPYANQYGRNNEYAEKNYAITEPDGTYHLFVRGEQHYYAAEFQVKPPPESDYVTVGTRLSDLRAGRIIRGLDFVLEDSAKIEGLVVDQDEQPIEEASISASWGRGGGRMNTTSDEVGHFSLEGVPADQTISLTVSASGYQAARRPQVSAKDGWQIVRMEPSFEVRMTILKGDSGELVESIEFRAERDFEIGRYTRGKIGPMQLEAENGIFVINSLGEGGWKLSLAEYDRLERRTTSYSTRETLELTAPTAPSEVVYELWPTAIVAGRVMAPALQPTGLPPHDSEGGGVVDNPATPAMEPVQGARVVLRPNLITLIDPSQQLTTNENGEFTFEDVAMGSYTLEAIKEPWVSPAPLEVQVTRAQPLGVSGITVALTAGGIIWGELRDEADAPIRNASVSIQFQRSDGMGWDRGPHTYSNEEGIYRFEGVPAGSHFMSTYIGGSSMQRYVEMQPGEMHREDFRLSGRVKIEGTLTVNGGSALAAMSRLHLTTPLAERAARSEVGADGAYSMLVDPGMNFVDHRPGLANGYQGQPAALHIPAEPPIQQFDIDLTSGPLDIVVEYPPGVPFKSGIAYLVPAEGHGVTYGYHRISIGQETTHVPKVWSNEYTMTFTSADRKWSGNSELFKTGPGLETAIFIEMKGASTEGKIGGWSKGELSNTEWRSLAWDATELYSPGALVDIWLQYDSGFHAGRIEWVRITDGTGAELARDTHEGWTGGDNWGNHYYLQLPGAAAAAPITVEASMRGDGGVDSNGSAYWLATE